MPAVEEIAKDTNGYIRRKLVAVGDSASGKSCLMMWVAPSENWLNCKTHSSINSMFSKGVFPEVGSSLRRRHHRFSSWLQQKSYHFTGGQILSIFKHATRLAANAKT
jgi:tRNA A37 N6-isopentenylltransferase MiaA